MNIIEIFEESISVLTTNKMRTALSALGIIIGVGSVIALMTLGQASQASIKSRIQSLGANLLTIRPGTGGGGGNFLGGQSGAGTTLTLDDANAIALDDRIDTIDKVAAEYSSRGQIAFGRTNINATTIGVTKDYFDVRNLQLAAGSGITEDDINSVSKVAVISPTVATQLFGSETSGLGQELKIEGGTYRIIGITAASSGGFGGNSQDIVYVPMSTAQKILFGVTHVSTIYVTAKSEDDMTAAQNQLGFFLLERHRLATPDKADFTISSQEQILQTANQVTSTFTSLLTGIAAISLVVGGIGIMNIMLVTVTERTMEIGLRKALGAKRKTIVRQFLVEAIVLTIAGGLFGILLGIGVSYGITKFMNLSFVISVNAILLSAGVSCLIGILFGWYPAQKASKLQPIEALRYE
jgi:putative ABC transport system permease protein